MNTYPTIVRVRSPYGDYEAVAYAYVPANEMRLCPEHPNHIRLGAYPTDRVLLRRQPTGPWAAVPVERVSRVETEGLPLFEAGA